MDIAPLVFLFVLGACVGSFVNVAVLRFGFQERGGERSHCAACNGALYARDLIPILSYLTLGGRCRVCGSRISAQYPLVELLMGVLFVFTYLIAQPQDTIAYVMFATHIGFWAALVALVVYDIRHTLVPFQFLYGLYAFATVSVLVAAWGSQSITPLIDGISGAIAVGGFFTLISMATRGRGMGIGDAYVAGALGLMLGLGSGTAAGVLAVWIGALIGLILLALPHVFLSLRLLGMGRHVTLKTEIPFAPFLAVGALIAYATGIAPLDLGFWIIPY